MVFNEKIKTMKKKTTNKINNCEKMFCVLPVLILSCLPVTNMHEKMRQTSWFRLATHTGSLQWGQRKKFLFI
jgi:hypothetical protein